MYVENKDAEVKNLGGGVTRKILSYSRQLMTCELFFEEGAVGEMHSHPHEQIGYIVSGKLILKEEGQEDKVLVTGDTYHILPDIRHGVVTLAPTKLLDIFTPMREDFLNGQ